MKKAATFLALICLPLMALSAGKKEITITQEGRTVLLQDEENKIMLKKAAFTIRFYNKRYTDDTPYATMISAFTDEASLGKVRVGVKTEDTPFFSPGTGLAADQTGYSAIFLDNEANHYLYYKDEKDKRADLVSDDKGILTLEWTPHSFYLKGKDTQFADAGISTVYFVMFTDNNRNGIVDKGELKKVTLTFK